MTHANISLSNEKHVHMLENLRGEAKKKTLLDAVSIFATGVTRLILNVVAWITPIWSNVCLLAMSWCTGSCQRRSPGPDRGRWLQDVWFMLIPCLLRPGFRVMWERRQRPAGMQLRVLAQIRKLAPALVLEWIWVLVQVGVGRQNMKTAVGWQEEQGWGTTVLNEWRGR